jgi:hypothetical protein
VSDQQTGSISLTDAEVGAEYRVTWDDCCVQGSFQARVASKKYVPDPPETEDFLDSVTFDNGVTLSGSSFGYAMEPVS